MHLKITMKGEPVTYAEVKLKRTADAVELIKSLVKDNTCEITVLAKPPVDEFEIRFKNK